MSITVYVIRHSKSGELYKGQTSDVAKRVEQHNQGQTKSTKRLSGEWHLVYSEEYDTRDEALKREKYLKSAAGRRFLKKVLI